MVPGNKYKWSGGIFAKKTKFHDAGGPGTVVSPINGFVNINVFYKQNYANKGVGDIAHAPGISKQSCLLLFQIYSSLLAAVVWVARPWQLGMEVTQTEVK